MISSQRAAATLFFLGAVITTICPSNICSAQLPDPAAKYTTFNYFNGRYWNALNETAKSAFIVGFSDALVMVDEKKAREYVGAPITNGERIAALDQMFADPTNILVAIINLLRIIDEKARGIPQTEIDAELSFLRMAAAKAPERSR